MYKVKDMRSNEIYAMKVINKPGLSARQTERLRTEIAIAKTVNHPGLLRMHDLLGSASKYMLVMDLAARGELMNEVTDVIKEEKAAEYIIQIAVIVRFCHSLGIVHRDLKFENVLIAEDGHLMVSDFGLGKLAM